MSLVDVRWPWDEAAFLWLNGLGVPALDALWAAASSHVFGIGVAVASAMWLVARYRRASVGALLQLGAAIALTDLLGARLLKPFFSRMRPSFAVEWARVLCPASNSGSMPSLHSANAFAVATLVTLVVPRAGFVMIPLAALVAISRVGCGVHWPSDVLVGAVYGTGMAVLVRLSVERAAKASQRLSVLSTPRSHGRPASS